MRPSAPSTVAASRSAWNVRTGARSSGFRTAGSEFHRTSWRECSNRSSRWSVDGPGEPPGPSTLHLEERFEHSRQLVLWNSDPAVLNPEDRAPVRTFHADRDAATVLGALGRIRQEVQKDLP